MGLLMLWIGGYILNGFFLGHLYRDAIEDVQHDLSTAAQIRLTGDDRSDLVLDEIDFALYEGGVLTSGPDYAPELWPEWLSGEKASTRHTFVAQPEGEPTLAAAVGSGRKGVLAIYAGDLGELLSQKSGVWIGLIRSDAPEQPSLIHLNLGNRDIPLRPFTATRGNEERDAFFGIEKDAPLPYFDRPRVWWGELTPSLSSLEDGSEVADYTVASLNSSPRASFEHFFSDSAEIDTAAWAALIAISGMLATIYAIAVGMAAIIIIALSRAVNRLSHATSNVSRGDFSVRIPAKRSDQVGQLQRDFNQMAEHLEQLVETAAQKEVIDKELSLARDLQERLIPMDLPKAESIEFSTLFKPSAAIGGDYFDILRIDSDRLAVVIADVSGHGLPTGLRMAMLKAALVILVEEKKPPQQILERLSELVRSSEEKRYFVTSTIAVINFRTGRLEITNAGHPPTYLLRNGEVEEILLPGPPLGTLSGNYGYHEVDLTAGDVVVWLSDGLIEATTAAGDPFGYDRLAAALAGPTSSPQEARDRLLNAVEEYTGGHPADDDRTLVAMGFTGSEPEAD
jgi:serine phosphatase RsbU (regulator of sigma subunit)